MGYEGLESRRDGDGDQLTGGEARVLDADGVAAGMVRRGAAADAEAAGLAVRDRLRRRAGIPGGKADPDAAHDGRTGR